MLDVSGLSVIPSTPAATRIARTATMDATMIAVSMATR
jgi:hypothetical protein